MFGKGTGGGTSFEDMSHEQMLAWLDQANAGTVQGAADRLTAAAKEIRKIAEELKVRPQYVEWKGEGADAFRTWSGDLANSTLRLGDFSEGAAKWLGETSGAIATAQASIPRDTKSAQANLDAAQAALNDPDAAAVSSKSTSELAALAADKEKVRQEAAAQMRKLGQTYSLSATQLDGLERPKFPPPPAAILPRDVGEQSTDLARPGAATSGGARGSAIGSGTAGAVGVTHEYVATLGRPEARVPTSGVSSHQLSPSAIEPSAHVGIDSAATLPEVRQPSTSATGGVPATAHPEAGVSPSAGGILPPIPGGTARTSLAPGGQGRSVIGGRISAQPAQGAAGSALGRGVTEGSQIPSRNVPGSGVNPGRTVPGQGLPSGRGVPANSGITGGRPSATPTRGRPMGRLPGGTVVGGEPAGSRGSTGRVPTTGGGQPVVHPAGPTAGRPMPTPREGIVGGTPQQTGRTPARPGAPVPSAPTQGGVSGGTPSNAGTRSGVRGSPAASPGGVRQGKRKRQPARRSEPPTAD